MVSVPVVKKKSVIVVNVSNAKMRVVAAVSVKIASNN